jgi:hypothetical protein
MFSTQFPLAALAAALLVAGASAARADAITDWNLRSAQIVADARIGTPPAVRVMALVQTAADEAARDAARSLPSNPAAVDTAIAAAHRAAFLALLPAQKVSIERAFDAATAQLPADPAQAQHLAFGERAAQRVLAARAHEMPRASDSYRPAAPAGVYVPTVAPAAVQWPQRAPWRLRSADQFRPAAPPALASARWAGEFNEIKALGARESAQRTPSQTTIARFWDHSLPAIYHGVVRSVAAQPGRDVLANARLFATAAQAMDDALIAVFDAKYTYNRWRPVTAIRNADADGHDDTQRDASWAPLIDTPMHPEYPCAHCVLAGAVAEVVKAETRGAAQPLLLSTTSPTATDGPRSWSDADEFAAEVALARIAAGVHFRSSTEAGVELGRRVGRWVVNSPRTSADH